MRRRWAYHSTERSNVESILHQGLLPQAHEEDDTPVVYFNDTCEEAMTHGGRDIVLFRFPWPKDAQREGGAWTTLRRVPPSRLELLSCD